MVYVGLDVSGKSLVAYAVNERKQRVFEGEQPASRVGLAALVRQIGGGPKLVACEAGHQMKWIAETLKKLNDVQVHVVPPNEVKWITESGGKTDRVDAKKLAELARADLLPRAVHVVEGPVRELREWVSARQQLQRKRIALINTIRGDVYQEGHRLPEKILCRADLGGEARAVAGECAVAAHQPGVHGEYRGARCGRAAAHPAAGGAPGSTLPAAREHSGPRATGVPRRAGRGDEARRFDDQKAVANYGALAPTIDQSGTVRQLGRSNRNGRGEVRRVLWQCAHTVVRLKSAGTKRRGKNIAVVALARRLLTTAYGVLKSGTRYDPRKLQPA